MWQVTIKYVVLVAIMAVITGYFIGNVLPVSSFQEEQQPYNPQNLKLGDLVFWKGNSNLKGTISSVSGNTVCVKIYIGKSWDGTVLFEKLEFNMAELSLIGNNE